MLILSLFPGVDLLGMGFELEGFCVVRGPDLIFGGDIRRFTPPAGVFSGVLGGSPCQDFSKIRRDAPTGYGVEMLSEFARCVTAAAPEWFLLENVPGVPSIEIPGYKVQRFNARASEFGGKQHRLRTFQFGSCDGAPLVLLRPVTKPIATEAAALASKHGGRSWAKFCELQGVPEDFLSDSPFTKAGKYRAVGNGVFVRLARAVAIAIATRHVTRERTCICECGRPVKPGATLATAACRKRMQRRRDAAGVTEPGMVTSGLSQTVLL